MIDDNGKPVKEAGPATPLKVLGFTGLPNAGDEFLVMESERAAKTLSDERLETKRAEKLSVPQRATLETLLEAADGKKTLRLVLKCDTQGSVEAICAALQQIESKKVELDIEDKPGSLGKLTRKIADAGVNLNAVYLATKTRVVIGARDLEKARAAVGEGAASRQ